MASVVTLCNLALSHLGDRATVSSIDPPEGSAQADHCAQFWPIARDEALSSEDWRFASTVAPLVAVDDTLQTDTRWRYGYVVPADFLVARELVFSNGATVPLEPGSPLWELGTLASGAPIIFTNYEDVALRYTRRIADPNRYPSRFSTALSYLLASYLAGPVVKGKTGAQASMTARSMWDKLRSEASVTDANQAKTSSAFTPSGLRARGDASGEGRTIEDGTARRELPFWAQ